MSFSKPAVKRKESHSQGEFVKKCILQAASIICPEKKGQFSNISLSANTVAERISDLSNDIYDQLCEKAKCFSEYSVALDETTDITDTAQLAMYVRGVNDNFEVMEELLRVIPMHGRTTAQEIFCQLCDAIKNAGLPWKRFVGITTDGAPSMTGRKNYNVRAFSTKLVLWKAQLSQTNLCHFPACKALADAGTPFSGKKYVDVILKLQEEFDHRFADFKTHRATFQIFADPFSFDVQDASPVLQIELIDLQCNSK
ncbi:protein transcription factor II-I repeat domain-containing protein 2B-like protein [Silurus meridionalis]|nr:protein transcription factor II-I repeat domain-containing protein 2B-like protein [Silurus meridionalis]